MIIDAKNKDYIVTIFKAFTENIKSEYTGFKKNPAYLVQLTE